ncbi:glycosyltransferase [Hanstruepera flava]|uniref:glycosyltransferase n=1 Tax=Hanstruepera flava TaxID=2930218 RepID=UPI0020284145|nr:glycosyltransferase [Hanstruepera flava]
MRTLTIISHTEHYQRKDGRVVGLGATVMEINHLLDIFDTIYHVAMLHKGVAPDNCLEYVSKRIVFVPIPPVGGKTWIDKGAMLWRMPRILNRVRKTLKQTDYFQFRAPTGIGVFIVPYLIFLHKGKGWFKYAGNWSAKQSPLAYRFQNFLLKRQRRLVTMNGRWPEQPKHCISFENPCLTADEVIEGEILINQKYFEPGHINFCFVGRLEPQKGLDILLEALSGLSESDKTKIQVVHIVGGGSQLEAYKRRAQNLTINIRFHGVLSRTAVHDIYKTSHVLILPSHSEGFPKVVAEALNYGCLPMVSNIPAIGDYVIAGESGFLFDRLEPDYVSKQIRQLLAVNQISFSKMIKSGHNVSRVFTYNQYNRNLFKYILN